MIGAFAPGDGTTVVLLRRYGLFPYLTFRANGHPICCARRFSSAVFSIAWLCLVHSAFSRRARPLAVTLVVVLLLLFLSCATAQSAAGDIFFAFVLSP